MTNKGAHELTESSANRTAARGSLLAAFAERAAARARAQSEKAFAEAAAFDELAARGRAQASANDPNPDDVVAPPRRAGPVDIDELYARASGSPGLVAQTAPPADAVWVAQTCANAGFPELTVKLLQKRATVSAVEADIERAASILQVARSFHVPELATTAIVNGLGADVFREMAASMKADAQATIITAPSGGAMQAAVKKPNAPAIYDRLNRSDN